MELSLHFNATAFTPPTSLVYRTSGDDPKVVEAFARVGPVEKPTAADASIVELVFRYRQKHVDRAVLSVGDVVHEDGDGRGCVEIRDGKPASGNASAWQIANQTFETSAKIGGVELAQQLYELVPNLTGEEAMARAFVATCGSTAAVVHEMRGHSVLWASIPPGGRPNEVHRHLGGSVYCLFFRGTGRFHRVDPQRGFETLTIHITKSNSFQLISIPSHLWYQPINTGDTDLQYFMIHEPAFDRSELLVLDESDCREEWGFEY